MAQDPYFDGPQQLRELAERSVEQTRGVNCQILEAQAPSMWLDAMPCNETTLDLMAVHERAVRFAKPNGEACFAFARELAKARDAQDGIQGRYAQTQMQAYALQAQELGNLMARASQSMRSRS
jgi:hypothetical protein